VALVSTNTFGNVQVDTRTMIDRMYGVLRLRPEQITVEMVQIALDTMNLVQLDLVNDAAPLWTKNKVLMPLVQGQRHYVLPTGTNDIDKAFYRTVSNVTGTATSSSSSYLVNFGSATYVSQVQVTFPSAVFPFVIQSSPDGINWTTAYTSSIYDTGNGSLNVWVDTSNSNAQVYWQVIPATVSPVNGQAITPANTMTGVTALFYNTPSDIEMYRMNKDDYWNMTNKNFQGRPTQYWLNREVKPTIDLWPQPDALAAQNCLYIWRQRYLMDVGSLQQTVEFPGRWYLPFIYMVADELGFVTPEVDPQVAANVSAKADKMRQRAFLEERDKSPVKFRTNIGIYTR
jgi:hypothetical protein